MQHWSALPTEATFIDVVATDVMPISQRRITEDGFLEAPAVLARTGIQEYKAHELGLDSVPSDRVYKLYRPPEEVFAQDSISSFHRVPVTLNHPPGNRVTAQNWRQLSVGDAHEPKREGDHMAGTILVRDSAAIAEIQKGNSALSNGYTFKLDLTPGTFNGQAYDGVQRQIRGNHVAVVTVGKPRGGPSCRIADSQPEPLTQEHKKMPTRIVVDSIPLEMDEAAAAHVNRIVAERKTAQDSLTAANAKLAATLKIGDAVIGVSDAPALQTAIDKQTAQLKEATDKALNPAQIDALVSARTKLVGDAQKILATLKPDGKADVAIMREAIGALKDGPAKNAAVALLDGKAVGDADETNVRSAFKAAVAAGGNASVRTGDTDPNLARTFIGDQSSATGNNAPKPVGRNALLANLNAGHEKTQHAKKN